MATIRLVVDFMTFAATSSLVLLGLPLFAGFVLLSLFFPQTRRATSHAMSWTFSPEDRSHIAALVQQRITKVQADARVLVGHSQGGSILTELLTASNQGVLRSMATALVTLGTGHGYLTVLHGTKARGTLISLIAAGAVGLLGLASIVVIGPMVASAILLVTGFFWIFIYQAAAVWLIGLSATSSGWWSRQALIAMLELIKTTAVGVGAPFLLPLLLISSSTTLVLLGLARRARRSVDALRETGRFDAEGADVVASHDPVGSIFAVIAGTNDRLQLAPGKASLLTDHITYFDNAAYVIAPLEQHVLEAAAPGSSSVRVKLRQRLQDGHQDLMRTRLWRPIAVITSAAFALSLTATSSPWVVAVAAATGYRWAAYVVDSGFQYRNKLASRQPYLQSPLPPMSGLAARVMTIWFSPAAALMMFGAAASTGALPAPITGSLTPAYASETGSAALLAGLLLTTGVVAFRIRSAKATSLLSGGWLLASGVWIGRGGSPGLAIGALHILAGIWTLRPTAE